MGQEAEAPKPEVGSEPKVKEVPKERDGGREMVYTWIRSLVMNVRLVRFMDLDKNRANIPILLKWLLWMHPSTCLDVRVWQS